ncbi:unnamed protein product [Strongylus vulgaris]|uniref:Uncharacterized protein n=1 Tax=Strongylus vulgaris TaxID=40348 RepID=A0A3P7IC86_STRVU|nr:unnamed protein product [Strongylus vulgaris]
MKAELDCPESLIREIVTQFRRLHNFVCPWAHSSKGRAYVPSDKISDTQISRNKLRNKIFLRPMMIASMLGDVYEKSGQTMILVFTSSVYDYKTRLTAYGYYSRIWFFSVPLAVPVVNLSLA